MLAIRFQNPAIVLAPEEAKRLDEAIKRVWKHYPVAVTQKQLDISFALWTVGEIYGTRVMAAIVDKKAAKNKPADAEGGNVTVFPWASGLNNG